MSHVRDIEGKSLKSNEEKPFVIKLMNFKKKTYIIFFIKPVHSNLEHNLRELFLILLSVFVKHNLAELWKEN